METYPPKPTTTSAPRASSTSPARRTAPTRRAGTLTRSTENLRGSGTGGIMSICNPASGMTRPSKPLGVPMHDTCSTWAIPTSCCAVAMSGEVCPAVPPPASTTLTMCQSFPFLPIAGSVAAGIVDHRCHPRWFSAAGGIQVPLSRWFPACAREQNAHCRQVRHQC